MAASDDDPRTTGEVVQRVQVDWAALEDAIAPLSEADLTTPGADGWSVKDHLAHIGEWDHQLALVVGGHSQPDAFELDPATAARVSADIDALNDVLYQRSRDLSIAEVQANARRAHAEVLAALGRLSDADLDRPVSHFSGNPDEVHPLSQKIAVDTYAHYREHIDWIGTLLAAL